MRRVSYLVAATLDGRIARRDGSFDFFNAAGDAHLADYVASLHHFDAVLMGRKTYEIGLAMGVTDPYPFLDSYVFSSSMSESPNERVHLIGESPASWVRGFKQRPGGAIYLCGGAQLAAALLEAGLIDEVVVKLNPLLIGDGLPLFHAIKQPTLLALTGTKTYENGVVLLTYLLNDDRAAAQSRARAIPESL